MVGEIVLFVLWILAGLAFNLFVRKVDANISMLKRENISLAKAEKVALNRADEAITRADIAIKMANDCLAKRDEDHEVRIAFLENSLTAKTSEAKIVPKATKPNWKTFRTAAEKATEQENPE